MDLEVRGTRGIRGSAHKYATMWMQIDENSAIGGLPRRNHDPARRRWNRVHPLPALARTRLPGSQRPGGPRGAGGRRPRGRPAGRGGGLRQLRHGRLGPAQHPRPGRPAAPPTAACSPRTSRSSTSRGLAPRAPSPSTRLAQAVRAGADLVLALGVEKVFVPDDPVKTFRLFQGADNLYAEEWQAFFAENGARTGTLRAPPPAPVVPRRPRAPSAGAHGGPRDHGGAARRHCREEPRPQRPQPPRPVSGAHDAGPGAGGQARGGALHPEHVLPRERRRGRGAPRQPRWAARQAERTRPAA